MPECSSRYDSAISPPDIADIRHLSWSVFVRFSVGKASLQYFAKSNFEGSPFSKYDIAHSKLSENLTSPFSDKGINIHERLQEQRRLVEPGLLLVQVDHDDPHEGLVGEASLLAVHQLVVDGGVHHRLKLILLDGVVREQVLPVRRVGLRLKIKRTKMMICMALFFEAVFLI